MFTTSSNADRNTLNPADLANLQIDPRPSNRNSRANPGDDALTYDDGQGGGEDYDSNAQERSELNGYGPRSDHEACLRFISHILTP
jgi:hypothetical protein